MTRKNKSYLDDIDKRNVAAIGYFLLGVLSLVNNIALGTLIGVGVSMVVIFFWYLPAYYIIKNKTSKGLSYLILSHLIVRIILTILFLVTLLLSGNIFSSTSPILLVGLVISTFVSILLWNIREE